MTFADFTHPDDLQADLELYEQAGRGERDTYQIEKRFIRKDGGIVWARLAVSLVRDSVGNPQFAVGMAVDVTTEKYAQQKLASSEARYRQLVEQAADGIFLVDVQRRDTRSQSKCVRPVGLLTCRIARHFSCEIDRTRGSGAGSAAPRTD
jgi:PAS domain-containing protein